MEDDELPPVWVHRHHHGRLLFAILGMLLVGILGLVSDEAMSQLGRRLLRWHEGLSQ